MKIFANDKVYVQKNDIAFLNSTDIEIPASIFLKLFGNGITIIDNRNRFEFVEFDNEKDIEYIRNLDCVIDYDSVKDLTESEIEELGKNISQERNSIAEKYNEMSEEERMKNVGMVTECDMLEHKMFSLVEIFKFKHGIIEMTLPEGIEYPADIKRENKLKKMLKKLRKY